ncbi:MAG: BREX-1 system adenine-specific DNA-methyltransferase PglX [Caulobacterales bacterium]|nr:BREX-1 system adenine-specific DNA-methyltransferase PglX [Caulobacterales bacterium]
MDNAKLKPFAQEARKSLMTQVAVALEKVLTADDIETRVYEVQIKKLKAALNSSTKEEIIEKTAYTWFNRFVALRYMDLNNQNRIRIVSPAEGFTQPELLQEAKSGNIAFGTPSQKLEIANFLNRTKPSTDPDTDAYRILFIAACNTLNEKLPSMFEKIDDYAEILLPHDLLSENSVLSNVVKTLDTDACENVEVIGWLYQYYISAKKDQVFDDIKKKKQKVTPENIPAVTQLFTPHWIVKYLVENSLGRLWMLNNPNSSLIDEMEYYIKPETTETEFLRINTPEEIKICDPACGSGHMLTYAFDLLYKIYQERGYAPSEISSLIIKNNLFGIEIDDRAGALASFALSMKACEKDRRFLGRENRPEPNICVLEDIKFHEGELKNYMDELGANLFTNNIKNTLHDFREAKNFGSLIRPHTTDVAFALNELSQKDLGGNLLLYPTHQLVIKALKFAGFLSPKYHIVVANPPYMGGSNGTASLGEFLKQKYPDSKTDLFAAFIERNLELNFKGGMTAMVTMQSWMFLSSYEKLRIKLLENKTILSMAHLGARGFDSIGGEVVQTTAFVLENGFKKDFEGTFFRLVDGRNEAEKAEMLRKSVVDEVGVT